MLGLAPVALYVLAGPALAQTEPASKAPAKPGGANVSEVVVTASRMNLLGKAETASQGVVTRQEVLLRPIVRVGQLYETVPGLVVTIHSGEGKANQYLLRGYNLDHGTDFASFVDGMPVNRPTNAHGQGYSDQSFLMPQIVSGIDYTKGPYYAAIGDFGAVGSAHVHLLDVLPNQASVMVGTFGDEEVYGGGTVSLRDDDRVWAAIDLAHIDGPWDPPGDFRKGQAAIRYSHGTEAEGFSLTGMYYQSIGRLMTDQPLRAFQDGLIGRYQTLDPTDLSKSERASLSARYAASASNWSFTGGVYALQSTMTLWNNFTHFLMDPVNGDQEEQDENRKTVGGDAAYTLFLKPFGIQSDTTFGVVARYDDAYVNHRHTLHRQPLDYCEVQQDDGSFAPVPAVNFDCQADRAHVLDVGPYVENTTHWNGWLRTVFGLREEYYEAHDRSIVTGFSGSAHQFLFQPKGSIILGPWGSTEFYVSAGRGFHSDDIRGVLGTVPGQGIPGAAGATPLLASATGEEVGLRSSLVPHVNLTLAVFREDFRSEQKYNADVGQDSASSPSRREGVEAGAQYRPWPFLELNGDVTFARARYQGTPAELADFGLNGPYIANSPSFIGSFGVLLDNLGPWFGGVQVRWLGSYPVSDGDKNPQDPGYKEVNLDIGYKLTQHVKLQASVFNLFNSKANASAYSYASRLPGEPIEGVTDMQVHPLEPISARFTATMSF
jgi:outer membrane receptor protein involved in Fe transport